MNIKLIIYHGPVYASPHPNAHAMRGRRRRRRRRRPALGQWEGSPSRGGLPALRGVPSLPRKWHRQIITRLPRSLASPSKNRSINEQIKGGIIGVRAS